MTNSNSSDEGPRIIVDEDWKTQVERERETLRNQKGAGDEPEQRNAEDIERFPPATFSGIVNMFASQAMAALGLLPDPMTGESEQNRPLAKFLIDTLGVLEEKSIGNRSEDESNELRDALHHLRMIFVTSAQQPKSKETKASSKIELP